MNACQWTNEYQEQQVSWQRMSEGYEMVDMEQEVQRGRKACAFASL